VKKVEELLLSNPAPNQSSAEAGRQVLAIRSCESRNKNEADGTDEKIEGKEQKKWSGGAAVS